MTRPARWIGLPGGVLLLLALFLPALEVCNSPVYPVSFPPVIPPYLFGGTVIGVYAATSPGARQALQIAAWAMGALVLALTALVVHSIAAERAAAWPTVGVALWWAGAVSYALTLRRTGSAEVRAARAVAIPALASTLWFGGILFDPEVLWGTGVAFLGSVLVLASAVVWEVEARRAPRRWYRRGHVDPLPPPARRARAGGL